MALIKCPECDRQISDKASACLHCGFPLQAPPPFNTEEFLESFNPQTFTSSFSSQQNFNTLDPNQSQAVQQIFDAAKQIFETTTKNPQSQQTFTQTTTRQSPPPQQEYTYPQPPMSQQEREFYRNEEPPASSNKGIKVFLIIGFIIFASIYGVKATLVDEKEKNANIPQENSVVATTKKADLELVGESNAEVTPYMVTISGSVKNNTSKTYRYVQVVVNIYDKDDNLLGTALDNVTNLEAGGTWKFKAIGSNPGGASRYKITDITGY